MGSEAANPPDATTATFVEQNTAFGVKLYRELGGSPGNLCFSPFSISSAMGMVYGGARGQTSAEIRQALNFTLEPQQLHPKFKEMTHSLMANARIANALCVTDGKPLEEFTALLKGNYDAEIFFGGLDEINGWAKKKTEGKIENILEQLDSDTAGVLLNVVYFDGSWESPFHKGWTKNRDFKLSKSESTEVPFMDQRISIKSVKGNDFLAVEIPYQKKLMSMIVLLPQEIDGLTQLEAQLFSGRLPKMLTALDQSVENEVDLILPKFKFATNYDLVPSFKKLGVNAAFSSGVADFSGAFTQSTSIAQIKHKAFIEVDETGTKAAAVTAVEWRTEMGVPEQFINRPFLFLIRDNQSGSILFMGRVADPRAP
jgi:serpin B